ncbi:hypothetical protein INT46_001900 [Mucor plumbeus]|uniref:F-box domain-containing protein n=1 Tax=Mucor plumbeus TaxID=97098 RepID=A0A8H7USK3_9FUNG|nr:hypothetical protein INT46_001900 [Mucor plumbeus]
MSDFPTEILLNIFQHLPMYSQNECLFVSRTWHSAARFFTDLNKNIVSLRGYYAIRQLSREIAVNPSRGTNIRKMLFIMRTGTGDPIQREEFLRILRGCPNLAELVFVDINPIYYILYMIDAAIDLPNLELVRVEDRMYLYSLGHNFVELAYMYRATINRLSVDLGDGYFSHALGVNEIPTYLNGFISLKYLSITTNSSIVFDSIIRSCPQLQILKLHIDYSRFQVQDASQDAPHISASQLEVLQIDGRAISHEMHTYLLNHCQHLKGLAISGFCEDIDIILQTFRSFNRSHALPITAFSFNDGFPVVSKMLQNISNWFPNVRQVELRGSDVSSLINNRHNMILDFNDLNIRYISIDLSGLFLSYRSPIERIALEIISDDFTVWYQKEGKWRSRSQFVIKDNKRYTNTVTKERRMHSIRTSVISIRSATIRNIRVHFLHHNSPLNQIINLSNN